MPDPTLIVGDGALPPRARFATDAPVLSLNGSWRFQLSPTVADAPDVTKLAWDVKQFGYRCWRVETPLFNPDNFNLREEDIFDGLSAFALLAIPEEAPMEPNMQRCVELTD